MCRVRSQYWDEVLQNVNCVGSVQLRLYNEFHGRTSKSFVTNTTGSNEVLVR